MTLSALGVFRDACEDSTGRGVAPVAEGKTRKSECGRHAGDKVIARVCILQGLAPAGYFLVQSLRGKRVKSGLPSADFAIKGEGPAFGRVFCAFCLL